MLTLTGIDEIRAQVGSELGVSDWHEVTQDSINEFAKATGDDYWIHLDPERAAETPFGGTIAHGYYTLSLGPMFTYAMFALEGFALGVNYGVNESASRRRCRSADAFGCGRSFFPLRRSPAGFS